MTVREGVAAVVRRDGRILLGLRCGSHEPGTWGLPGGKLDANELISECAVRELVEETGLLGAAVASLGQVETVIAGQNWRTRYVLVEAAGEPQVMEPAKHSAWQWFGSDDLPTPLFAPLAAYIAKHGGGLAVLIGAKR